MDAYGHNPKDFSLEEASGLPMPTLMGDFYREPDDITRGLSLPAGDSMGMPMDDFMLKGADFYGMPDVVRGVSMPSDFGLGGDFSAPPGFGMDFDKGMYGGGILEAPHEAGVQNEERFQFIGFAPPAPSDPFFTYAQTTLFVFCDRPHSLMNCLLDFFSTQVVASITKMNHTKLTIKADVFIDNAMCTLKARGYQQESGKIALEIQKRSGDSITFAGVYRGASKHISGNFAVEQRGMPEDNVGLLAPPLLAPLPRGKVVAQDYWPLLDMAGQTHSPSLQVESAIALAAMTADPEVVHALCSEPQAMQDIAKLLEPDTLDIVLPVSTLMLNITQSPYAAEHCEGLLRMLLEKVRRLPTFQGASALARRQFSQALAAATRSCRQRLPEQMAHQLAGEIVEVMSASQDPMGTVDSAYGSLQEAYFCLSTQGFSPY